MPRRVLDTNVLINHWGDTFAGVQPNDITARRARACAKRLIELQGTTGILTPVYLEFICGKGSAHDVRLAKEFLDEFEVVDGGEVISDDWVEAKRIASRVMPDGLRRQMGDCLIRALCNRLRLDVYTHEKRFPN